MKMFWMITFMAAAGAATALAVAPASAGGPPACQGLTGSARTNCLNAEVARGRQELADIDRRNHRLDTAKKVVCAGRMVGAAGAGGVAGSVVYHGSAAAADRALGNSHPCTNRAR